MDGRPHADGVEEPSDAALIRRVRAGDDGAYGELWSRHAPAGLRLARRLVRSRRDAEDLLAEAFTRVLGAIRRDRGPTEAFRPYLYTTMRRAAYEEAGRTPVLDLRDPLWDDPDLYLVDPSLEGLDHELAARAFARLPERWRLALWHLEVEQSSPAEIAPLLGLSPNAVAALGHRAREGLREAYLRVHLAQPLAGAVAERGHRVG